MLTIIYGKLWGTDKISKEWGAGGVAVPIFKKGDNKICKNCRGLILLSTPTKIYEWILDHKLKGEIEHKQITDKIYKLI